MQDDPRPAPPASPPRPKKRGRRLLTLVVAVVLVALGGLAYAALRIPRLGAGELTSLDRHQLGQPRTFLVVGTDSRERLPEDFPDFFGPGAGKRADVIMLVHMVPGRTRAQILSLPRDLKVEIPGRGTDKINAALAHGGPDLMVRTVRAAVGVPVHHYLEMDFRGFAQIVDALGGVEVYFPYPARDHLSGLMVEAGPNHLRGGMALAYVRSRSYQELREGSWVGVEADDIGRIERQQRLVFAILSKARSPSGLVRAPLVIEALADSVVADRALGVRAMAGLGWRLPFLDASDVDAMALPVRTSSEGGVSYVVRVDPEAQAVIDAFRSGRSMRVAAEGPPRVQVLNGNGLPGAAREMADLLRARGYPVVRVGDADRSDYQETLLVVRAENIERARLLAADLGFGRVVTGETPGDVDVLMIVGLDRA